MVSDFLSAARICSIETSRTVPVFDGCQMPIPIRLSTYQELTYT
jgi:hypothetical protein